MTKRMAIIIVLVLALVAYAAYVIDSVRRTDTHRVGPPDQRDEISRPRNAGPQDSNQGQSKKGESAGADAISPVSIHPAMTATDSPDEARATPVPTPPGSKLVFESAPVPPNVRHHANRSEDRLMYEIMGGGVLVADFNRDAAPDLLVVDSAPAPGRDRTRHPMLFGDGQGGWTAAPESWIPRTAGYAMGAVDGDFDNDGWTDLLMTTFGGGNYLFRNTGNGFEDVSQASGVTGDETHRKGWNTSAGVLDLDQDGALDFFIVRYVDYDPAVAPRCYSAGIHVYCTPIIFDAEPDILLLNNGNGTFREAEAVMKGVEPGKGLALAISDLNRDGRPDVFVANDTSPNHLWVSDPGGDLSELGMLTGVAFSSVGKEEGSMGADVADVNGDGLLDIFCTNFQYETTSLYVQASPFYFLESSDRLGIGGTARRRLSFGIDAFDADNDGDEDLVVANGHIEDTIGQYKQGVGFAQPDSLYEWKNGRFLDVSETAGEAISAPRVSRGLATADFDADGRLDIVIGVNDGAPVIALNRTPSCGHYLALRLEGVSGNRSAVGVKVVAYAGDRVVRREIVGAVSYLSSSDKAVHLGLGDATAVDRIEIDWPGGSVQTIDGDGLPIDRVYRVIEGSAPVQVVPGQSVTVPEQVQRKKG